MARRPVDQATGLRQLVPSSPIRSVSITGSLGSAGATTTAINLAAALAERHREVLVLDEFSGSNTISQRLRLPERFQLEHVLQRQIELCSLLQITAEGFALLPFAAAPAALACLNDIEQRWLASEFEQLSSFADFILLDTRPSTTPGVASLSIAADDVVIVLNNRADSLTDSYASIKLLATEHGRRDFRILVNRVSSLAEATALFQRLKQVALQFLDETLTLRLIGYVPEDDAIAQASRMGCSVLAAFPESEASVAFRQLADSMLRWAAPLQPASSPAGFIHHLVESCRRRFDRYDEAQQHP
ncbi:MinD/ParA family ATP-binding protein [Chitinilyticum piscinae]|uniref:AAA family ATPase n=1 Tax=Chitinilyticum piscinae TaxID=2866724 RepID=A0A8J7G224_9NEIS|nr:AAA family ATPase [Chitinilyticum piscinae]MBE9609953.1 AAA family ATPase [Chitinilyticum piscinae]